MNYPPDLDPTATEELVLPSRRAVRLPKATPVFRRWPGEPPADAYGNKALIEVNGELVFAELAILRLFQADGWDGVWIDTYRRRMRIGIDKAAELPAGKDTLLQAIYQAAQTKSGCFDVFCWKKDTVLFAESKRKQHDQIRQSQLVWLEAALSVGLSPDAFLLVEWTLTET